MSSTRTITVKINHHKQQQHNNHIASFNKTNTTVPTVSKQQHHNNNHRNSHTIQQPNSNEKKNQKNSKNGRSKNNVSKKVAPVVVSSSSSSEDESGLTYSSSSSSSSSEDERQHQHYAPKSFSPKRNHYKQQRISFVDQVYAGPTFNNAPAPSALPIPPAFNARGSPIFIHPHPHQVTPVMTLEQQSLDLMNLINVVVTPQKVVTAYELEKNNLALSEIQQGLRSMLKIES